MMIVNLSPYRCENNCTHAKPSKGYVKYLVGADLQCVIEGKKIRDLSDERLRLINQNGCASHSDLQDLVAELVNKNILLVDAERNIVCIYNPGLFDRYNSPRHGGESPAHRGCEGAVSEDSRKED
jgi:hypothetical protein